MDTISPEPSSPWKNNLLPKSFNTLHTAAMVCMDCSVIVKKCIGMLPLTANINCMCSKVDAMKEIGSESIFQGLFGSLGDSVHSRKCDGPLAFRFSSR